LISKPFTKGLKITLIASFVMMLVAAWASWMRGAKYVHRDDVAGSEAAPAVAGTAAAVAPVQAAVVASDADALVPAGAPANGADPEAEEAVRA
jgi:hypothetical protein